MVLEDGLDRWPTFELSATDYERVVANLVRTTNHQVVGWEVKHLDPIDGVDGTYIIDVTVRFQLLGADFLMLFECKRHSSPVKREHVQVLNDKLRSTGSHKGVIVAASGFQKGALEYAKTHGIACVRLVDDAWTYEIRSRDPYAPEPTGHYAAYWRYLTEGGYGNKLLSGRTDYSREALFNQYEQHESSA